MRDGLPNGRGVEGGLGAVHASVQRLAGPVEIFDRLHNGLCHYQVNHRALWPPSAVKADDEAQSLELELELELSRVCFLAARHVGEKFAGRSRQLQLDISLVMMPYQVFHRKVDLPFPARVAAV